MSHGVHSQPDSTAPIEDKVPGSLASDVNRLVRSARALLGDQLRLLALESRRAARALGAIAALGVAAGILMACTWLGLSAACALWLIEQGARPSAAILASCLLDLIGLLAFCVAIHRESRSLTFPASFQSLQASKGTGAQ
jgi:uncharacterized membrane protein YqjE